MKIIDAAHWLIPWPILIVGLTAIYRFARGHVNERPFTEEDRRLVLIFSGLLDLQARSG